MLPGSWDADEFDVFQDSRGTISRAMARSKSCLNWLSRVAYGARFSWAKAIASATAVGCDEEDVKEARMSSTSCRRRSEK